MTAPGQRPEIALRWETGKLGCLLPVVAICVLYTGWAIRRPEALEGRRTRGFIDVVEPMTIGGVNVPILLLSLYLLWEFFRMIMRWADQVAVEATPDGLRFHWSLLRRRFIPWQEVRDARFRLAYRYTTTIPEVGLFVGRQVVKVRGFDNSDNAGKRFAEAVRARIHGKRLPEPLQT